MDKAEVTRVTCQGLNLIICRDEVLLLTRQFSRILQTYSKSRHLLFVFVKYVLLGLSKSGSILFIDNCEVMHLELQVKGLLLILCASSNVYRSWLVGLTYKFLHPTR